MSIEKEYIDRIAKGDRSAFDSLFLLYYPRVKNFILGLVKNQEDAFDLSQDIFLKIWDNRENLPQVTYFKTYLFQMSKNAVLDSFRKKSLFDTYTEEQTSIQITEYTTNESIESDDLEKLIYGLVENMPDQRKIVFKMSRQNGMTNDEIAKELNISKRTVETHISNTLKEIRKVLSSINSFFL